ncbi:MAG: hypothetical protein KKI08_02795, partial [Armatimonadetes bacterium]|nr:hypothetical protein [Armatimonadota bacterium]
TEVGNLNRIKSLSPRALHVENASQSQRVEWIKGTKAAAKFLHVRRHDLEAVRDQAVIDGIAVQRGKGKVHPQFDYDKTRLASWWDRRVNQRRKQVKGVHP